MVDVSITLAITKLYQGVDTTLTVTVINMIINTVAIVTVIIVVVIIISTHTFHYN